MSLRSVFCLLLIGTILSVPILDSSVWKFGGNSTAAKAETNEWRRTTRGWEQVSHWELQSKIEGPLPAATAIHPLVVAGLQILASFAALLVFADREPRAAVDPSVGSVGSEDQSGPSDSPDDPAHS